MGQPDTADNQNQLELSALQKLEQRNRELAILKAIAEELNRVIDTRGALQSALKLVADLLGLRSGWIWLLDEASGEPYLAAALQLPPFLTEKPSRMRGNDCVCLESFLTGKLTMADNINVLRCSRLYGGVDSTDGLRYHASIPIYAHDKPLGVMNVASQDWRKLDVDDLQLLYIIGYQLGVAVERARLFDQASRLATAEERNRMAREIHDTIAQGMAAVVLNLESAEAHLSSTEPAAHNKALNKIKKALLLTRTNLEEMRRSVMDLRATPLQEKVLAEALETLVHTFAAENREVEAHFELADGTDPRRRYTARIETGLYRVAQEALTNVNKHARASTVRLTFQAELFLGRERLRLVVEDDGVGFDIASQQQKIAEKRPDRFGLVGMNERARLLGGQLEIKSCPGQGAKIELLVPLT
jgi:two-component system NarL family sensor kinase